MPVNIMSLKANKDIKGLITALNDEDESVRILAADALDKLGWKPDQGEAGALYWIVRRKYDNCVAIGAPAVPPLIAALKYTDLFKISIHKEEVVRAGAALALGKLGDGQAVEPLIAAFKDEHEHVRSAIALALKEIGHAAVEPLIAALKDEDKNVRRDAAGTLLLIYPFDVEPLIALFNDRDEAVCRNVVDAFWQLGSTATLIHYLSEANKGEVYRDVAKQELFLFSHGEFPKRVASGLFVF
jgi:HEAT repeat protein